MSFHTCREKDSSPSPVKLPKPEGIGQSRESEVEDRVGGSSLKSNYAVAFLLPKKVWLLRTWVQRGGGGLDIALY